MHPPLEGGDRDDVVVLVPYSAGPSYLALPFIYSTPLGNKVNFRVLIEKWAPFLRRYCRLSATLIRVLNVSRWNVD